MAQITIAAGNVGPQFHGSDTDLKLRIYCRKTFVSSGLEAIVKSTDDNFYDEVDCAVDGSGNVTHSGFTIDSTEDGSPSTSSYRFSLYDSTGELVQLVYRKIIVPATPTTTTLGALATYSNQPTTPVSTSTYNALVNYVDTAIAALSNMATKATTAAFGATRMSYAPATASTPIAVEDNDPIIRAIRKTVFLEDYTHTQSGLVNALAAIGSTQTELRITSQVSIADNLTIPSTCLITLEGNGSFLVADFVTLTIGSMTPPPPYKVFYATGTGKTVFSKNATGGIFHLEWWAGVSNSGSLDSIFTQVRASLIANVGGTLRIGPGTWKVKDFVIPDNTTIQGSGNGPTNTVGTVLQISDTAPAAVEMAVLRVSGASAQGRNVTLNDLTISTDAQTDKSCFIAGGVAPNTFLGLYFNRVTFHGTGSGAPGQLYIYDTGGTHAWEIVGIHCTDCQWATPVNGKSVHMDTVNSSITFVNRQTNNAIGSTFFYGAYTGWVNDILPDNRGVNATPDVTSSAFRTITGDGASSGGANIANGGFLLTMADAGTHWSKDDIGQRVVIAGKLDARVVSITTDGNGRTATVDTAATSAATFNTLVIHRYTPSTSKAKAVWWLISGRNAITVTNSVDEGYQYYLINDGSDILSPFTIYGGILQSRIKLNAAMALNIKDCRIPSNLIEGANGIVSRINAEGNSISEISIDGVTLTKPRLLGPQGTSGTAISLLHANRNANATAYGYEQTFGITTNLHRGNAGNSGLPVASRIASIAAVDDGSNPNRPVLFIGRLDPYTEEPDHGFDFYRDNSTGDLVCTPTQGAAYAFKYNGPLWTLARKSRATATNALTGGSALTSADYGLTIYWTPTNTATCTLPANGAPAGTFIEIVILANFAVTISAATADTLIAPNDTAADSVAFALGQAIGAKVRFESNGTSWIAVNIGSTTMTVNT